MVDGRQASAEVAAEQGFMEREELLLDERDRAQGRVAVGEEPEFGRIVLRGQRQAVELLFGLGDATDAVVVDEQVTCADRVEQ